VKSNHQLFKAEGDNGPVVLKKFTFRKNAELAGLYQNIYAVQKLQDRGVAGIIRITAIVHGGQGTCVRVCVCVCACVFVCVCVCSNPTTTLMMCTLYSYYCYRKRSSCVFSGDAVLPVHTANMVAERAQ